MCTTKNIDMNLTTLRLTRSPKARPTAKPEKKIFVLNSLKILAVTFKNF